MQSIGYEEELNGLLRRLGEAIAGALKELLEGKHLYQSIAVDFERPLADLPRQSESRRQMDDELLALLNADWMARDRADRRPPLLGARGVSFSTPDVKLFCTTCDRIEAFNSVSSEDLTERGHPTVSRDPSGAAVQAFAFSFQCQSCKGIPEVFLVRRQGGKLTQSGRAPIEHVEVPDVVPKSVQKWYSGAVVAHQSGQTLAGLFLLRTLIEQWARETTRQPNLPADRVLDTYMDLLPQDFKARFSSLRDLYGKLSDDMHRALGSVELFDEAIRGIVEHLEARRLFKLGEAVQASESAEPSG